MRNKRTKGFTLVEVIITIALLGIVGLAVITMMTSSSNVFSRITNQTQAKMKANQVMEVLIPQVRYGTELKRLSSESQMPASSGYRSIYTSGGRLYMCDSGNTSDLFGEPFYSNYNVAVELETSGNALDITVTVTFSGDPSLNSTLATSVQNLNAASISGSGNIISYQWLTAPASAST